MKRKSNAFWHQSVERRESNTFVAQPTKDTCACIRWLSLHASTPLLASRLLTLSRISVIRKSATQSMTEALGAPKAQNGVQQPHRHPPVASSSQSGDKHAFDTSSGPDTLNYVIHTETNGVSDLRLQVSHEPSTSFSKQPLRPVYFRERVLTDQNEIVDNIIDASTGRICWTIHRPTRGWYLYLRSPDLPAGTAISLRAAKRPEYDPLASPLTFSLQTKLWAQALGRTRPRIGQAAEATKEEAASQRYDGRGEEAENNGLAIHIGGDGKDADEVMRQDVALAATGRENRQSNTSGHARRRSGATGLGSHAALDSRHPSKRMSSAVASSPMIPETEDEAPSPPAPTHTNPTLSRLAIPSSTTASTSSSPHSAGADRPYSPTQPSTSSLSTPILSQPRACTFLLTDGLPPSSTAAAVAPKQSWTRWATSILPSEIRPSLSLDSDKSFSLYWLDPPNSTSEGVEVAKFEDQSGRWLWNSHTRGKLTLQTSAMQALGLQKEFWITAVLAYVQFLEDKDAYDAARDA